MQLLSLSADGAWEVIEAVMPAWDSSDAQLLEVDAEPDQVSGTAIGINFPAFNDGRGLSLAVLLRTRLNFEGDIYAVGEVHEDILHYLVRCGCNKIVLPEGCSAERALALIQPYSQYYQNSVIEREPSFKRVERGAKA